jgi:hypothetical protein
MIKLKKLTITIVELTNNKLNELKFINKLI